MTFYSLDSDLLPYTSTSIVTTPLKVTQSQKLNGQVHDIEDLVAEGRRRKACPYFASTQLAQDAELVFCPYRCTPFLLQFPLELACGDGADSSDCCCACFVCCIRSLEYDVVSASTRVHAVDKQLLTACSYLVHPVIRAARQISVKGAVLIFDEAHNIEDVAR